MSRFLGHGYAPFEHKAEGLSPFRYSAIIENVREPGYFTKKLIDAIPVRNRADLLGRSRHCRDLSIDRGMILVEDLAGISAAIEKMSEDDYLAKT